MTESTQVMYLARTETPLSPEELAFHLQFLTDASRQIAILNSKGYRIIGYMSQQDPRGVENPGVYDLDNKFIPGEGARDGDILLSGPQAALLLPKRRDKFMKKEGKGNENRTLCTPGDLEVKNLGQIVTAH